jgi:biotin carboxylase
MADRVLLLWPTTSYRADDFLAAARRLGIEVSIGSDRCHEIAKLWPHGEEPYYQAVPLDFRHPERAVGAICTLFAERPLGAVVPTDDHTAVVAAMAAEALGLPANPPGAVWAARDKRRLRARLAFAGVPSPACQVFPADADPQVLSVPLPCVVKPPHLSASRGVIRADDRAGFVAAFGRVAALLALPEVLARLPDERPAILVEAFVPGMEVALEGLVEQGRLRVLALFDKPDPLDGPFFEETLYVTPSRLDQAEQSAIAEVAQRGVAALGLRTGPVHAELRLPPGGEPVLIELAARSIGGLCSRTLRFGAGVSLEELILASALGRPLAPTPLEREGRAAGVAMIPIPRRGILRAVHGEVEARAVPLVEGITITAPLGSELVPLPEGSSYLGFVFARAADPAAVEGALREALARLCFEITPVLEVVDSP